MSTLRLARYLVSITFCIWLLQSIPYVIFSAIVPGSGCTIINVGLLRYYTYGYYVLFTGSLSIFISSLFSLLAYRNVRHLVRFQIPIERRRLDRQMTAMIFVRVIAFIIFLTPYTVYRICIISIDPASAFSKSGWIQLITVIFEWWLVWTYTVRSLLKIFE